MQDKAPAPAAGADSTKSTAGKTTAEVKAAVTTEPVAKLAKN